MSAAECVSVDERVSGPELRLVACAADVVELAAFRGRADTLVGIAGAQGQPLPAIGQLVSGAHGLTLCVRPQRWLLLGAPALPGANAAHWQDACAGAGSAVDLSSALTVLHLGGAGARQLLVRGCRLDLSGNAFPPGSAAATLMVQVAVILAALPSGMLLLTPASTSRHMRDWLCTTARSFGSMTLSEASVADFSVPELVVSEPTGDRH